MAEILWNERSAAHLYRRAAFGGRPDDIARSVNEGLDATVDRLLDYENTPNDDLDDRLALLNPDLATPIGIVTWWMTRMVHSSRQLEERMTFFLHDHFATSLNKVPRADLMLDQNELLRRFAAGNFTELTIEISKDPAMLLWLDNYTNVKDNPNENYARELLELFTLGHGHYSEDDVLESARAFTGWSLSRGDLGFLFRPLAHDFGAKTVLGRTGNWDGGDVVGFACSEMAHGHLIARKLFEYLVYENPDEDVIESLAMVYLDSGTELRPLIEAILKSPEMYSERAVWKRVKSPVEHAVMAVRQLGVDVDVARILVGALDQQAQIPFIPPDVNGWPSGMTWINSTTLLSRMNLAYQLTRFTTTTDFAAADFSSPESMVDFFLGVLGPLEVTSETRSELIKWLSPDGAVPTGAAGDVRLRSLIQMTLSLPEWQMN